MRETLSDPISTAPAGLRTNFQTVPVKDIPPPEPSDGASADRPVVLVVDDEPAVADTLSEILAQGGYAALAAYDGEDALETALLIPPELVIADIKLPGMSGIQLAAAVKGRFPDCKILLLSEPSASSDALELAKVDGKELELLNKPINPTDLLARVSATLK
jgi:DNA-binding response OmpR family regulator